MKANLDADDFRPYVGQTFEVVADGELFPITLRDVQPIEGPTVREGGAFSLDFTAPPARYLRQASYEIRCRGESWFLFIVPLGVKNGIFEYQILFN
jgi:hypothetical protein